MKFGDEIEYTLVKLDFTHEQDDRDLISPDVGAADEEIRNLRDQLTKALHSNGLLSYQLTLELKPSRADDSKARRAAASIQSLTDLLDASRQETNDLRKQLEESNVRVRVNNSEASRDAEQRVATATAKTAEILAAATTKAAEIVAAATVKKAQLVDTAQLQADKVVAKARRENKSAVQQRRGKKELFRFRTAPNCATTHPIIVEVAKALEVKENTIVTVGKIVEKALQGTVLEDQLKEEQEHSLAAHQARLRSDQSSRSLEDAKDEAYMEDKAAIEANRQKNISNRSETNRETIKNALFSVFIMMHRGYLNDPLNSRGADLVFVKRLLEDTIPFPFLKGLIEYEYSEKDVLPEVFNPIFKVLRSGFQGI
ncbi:hypothetical protein CAEBREN_15484 [Caenorhabditis brenneri]|uniref:Uncharacterized protein n=1 Tax=Caenorhabditis brenneri TaxID=135651 RepID=G0P023_CAEBE|nr:hypothetical protein CAEBREN_15484 [Caenorhabditis brenneri]